MTVVSDQAVGDVGPCAALQFGRSGNKIVRDKYGEIFSMKKFFRPSVVGIHVREGDDATSTKDVETVTELGFSASGQPKIIREETGADDGGFFGLNETDGGIRMSRQEVFSEKALGEMPGLRELAGAFEACMNPIDGRLSIVVFDPMAGGGIIADNLAGAGTASVVGLVEYGRKVACDAETILMGKSTDGRIVKQGAEKGDECGFRVEAEGFFYDCRRKNTNFFLAPAGITWSGQMSRLGFQPIWCVVPCFFDSCG